MSNESVIEHRANYHYTQTREDFLAICCQGDCSPHCKALILSILESWTNTKRDKGDSDFVYMSIPQWVKYTYMCYERNTICDCLAELIAEKMIERRAITMYNQETFEYRLNVKVVQELLRQLPDKEKNDVLPNLNAYMTYKEKRKATRGVREKSTTLESAEGVREKSHTVVDKSQGVREKSTRGYVKNQRNLESITNLNLTSTKNEDTFVVSATQNNAPPILPSTTENDSQPALFPETTIPIVTTSPKKTPKRDTTSCDMPALDAPWDTTTCRQLFNSWRGVPLMDFKMDNKAAAYLSENFSREVVTYIHNLMEEDEYWKDHDGGEIGNVARHIIEKMKSKGLTDRKATVVEPKTNVLPFPSQPATSTTPSQPKKPVRTQQQLDLIAMEKRFRNKPPTTLLQTAGV